MCLSARHIFLRWRFKFCNFSRSEQIPGCSGMAGAELCLHLLHNGSVHSKTSHLSLLDEDSSPDNRLLEWQSSLPFTACIAIAMCGRAGTPAIAKERLRVCATTGCCWGPWQYSTPLPTSFPHSALEEARLDSPGPLTATFHPSPALL